MAPIPLDQLGFGWRDHRSALWWLWHTYSRYRSFRRTLDGIPAKRCLKLILALFIHSLPYLGIVWFVRENIFFLFDVNRDLFIQPSVLTICSLILVGVVYGIAVSIVIETAWLKLLVTLSVKLSEVVGHFVSHKINNLSGKIARMAVSITSMCAWVPLFMVIMIASATDSILLNTITTLRPPSLEMARLVFGVTVFFTIVSTQFRIVFYLWRSVRVSG